VPGPADGADAVISGIRPNAHAANDYDQCRDVVSSAIRAAVRWIRDATCTPATSGHHVYRRWWDERAGRRSALLAWRVGAADS
jgi:hypothetical protein